MKRRVIQRRVVVFLMLLLGGGAIVNVAVAWGCILFYKVDPFTSVSEELTVFNADSDLWRPPSQWTSEQSHWRNSLGLQTTKDQEERIHSWTGKGYSVLQYHVVPKKLFTMGFVSHMGTARSARIWIGWPIYSLQANAEWNPDADVDIDPSKCEYRYSAGVVIGPLREEGGHLVLPISPKWPGFAINTIFYAAILWMVFFVPGKLKRTLRRRRGLCPACAYPVGTSNVCTECGAAPGRIAVTDVSTGEIGDADEF